MHLDVPRHAVGGDGSRCVTRSVDVPVPQRPGEWSARTQSSVYNLDAVALQKIADEIGAPTFDELATPIDAVPDDANIPAFRSGAGAWS